MAFSRQLPKLFSRAATERLATAEARDPEAGHCGILLSHHLRAREIEFINSLIDRKRVEVGFHSFTVHEILGT
jgi:hypothetical protein